MSKDWISLALNRIENKLHENEKLILDCKEFVSNRLEVNNKSREKYIRLLNSFKSPDFFCLDANKKEISYKQKQTITKRSGAGIFNIPAFNNRSDSSVLSNITSLKSGRKQEAVKVTANTRRMADGSYKGIKKSMDTLRKTGKMGDRHSKIAKNRKKNNTYNSHNKKTIEDINYEFSKLNLGYAILSNIYTGNKDKLKIKCNKDHVFYMKWNSIQQGQKCPFCRHPRNTEQKCRKIFEKTLKNKFPSKRPSWLINPLTGKRMELDGFCEELDLAFEYDGEFHYLPLFGKKALKKTRKRDLIKNIICFKNNISLIRIPYFIEDKEEYIIQELKKWSK